MIFFRVISSSFYVYEIWYARPFRSLAHWLIVPTSFPGLFPWRFGTGGKSPGNEVVILLFSGLEQFSDQDLNILRKATKPLLSWLEHTKRWLSNSKRVLLWKIFKILETTYINTHDRYVKMRKNFFLYFHKLLRSRYAENLTSGNCHWHSTTTRLSICFFTIRDEDIFILHLFSVFSPSVKQDDGRRGFLWIWANSGKLHCLFEIVILTLGTTQT